MSERKQPGAGGTVLVALAIIAAGLAGGGKLMASGEEALLREAAQLAAESPLDPDPLVESAEGAGAGELVEVGTRAPWKHSAAPGVVVSGTSADLAVGRAAQFLMSSGSVEEGRRIIALLSKGGIRLGPGPLDWTGIAVPRAYGELTPAEERDPERGLPRTITLARALLVGLWSLPPETPDGHVTGPAPGPVVAWTRTMDTMAVWVRNATRSVEECARQGSDTRMATWRALVLVEAMRAALRDYGDLGWCDDGRGESWEALSASLGRTRRLLKKKLGGPVSAG